MDDNTEPQFKDGDKVKSFNKKGEGYEVEKYYRAVITDYDDSQDTAEVLYLEGNRKGETHTEDLEDLAPLKQKTYLCLVGRSYGSSQNKQNAIRNALQHYDVAEDREEDVEMWIAEVDRNNWKIQGLGSVYSSFIDNEEEISVNPELAREISQRAEDTTSLIYSAEEGTEPYREGLNYKAVTNTVGY